MGLLLTLFAYEVANEYKVAFSTVMNNSATWIPLAFAAICVPLLLWGLSVNRKGRGIKWVTLVSALQAAHFHWHALPCLLLMGLLSSTGLILLHSPDKNSLLCATHREKQFYFPSDAATL